MTLPTTLLIALCATAQADPFSLDALLDDTAAPPTEVRAPNAEWPVQTHIDHLTKMMRIDWANKTDEILTLATIEFVGDHMRVY